MPRHSCPTINKVFRSGPPSETKITRSSEYLECFRPKCPPEAWHFVALGVWSESPYHSGQCSYEIAKNNFFNTWVVISTDLPDEDEEDEEDEEHHEDEGKNTIKRKSVARKDGDQAYFDLGEESFAPVALWQSCSSVIAICRDAPQDATIESMAKDMYDELWDIGLGLDE